MRWGPEVRGRREGPGGYREEVGGARGVMGGGGVMHEYLHH